MRRSRRTEAPEAKGLPPTESLPFHVEIYQIVDDALMKANRTDGTGWDWCWAELPRDWMDATPSRHAYRCLPLTIANQIGWWIRNPVGFAVTWNGRPEPGGMTFEFDAAADVWQGFINNQFGEGIVTWNTPFLFRTRPEGSRLLICGPANYFIPHAHPLTAVIESDWMSMSFTMNWKIMAAHEPVRFESGMPLFQAVPLRSNLCSDLETADVTYRRLVEDPAMFQAYQEWHLSRKQFHEQKSRGEVKGDRWQKDYFQGRDPSTGREVAPTHFTKVRPPAIRDLRPEAGAGATEVSQEPAMEDPSPSRDRPTLRIRDAAGPHEAAPTNGDHPSGREPSAAADGARPATPTAQAQPSLVDDEWRRWIAENLLLDGSIDSMIDAMVGRGISPEEAAAEIQKAAESPYIRGADRLRNRLRKRDWLLTTYRKLNRLHPASDQVERREKLPREEFLRDYYTTNRPVIITGMMDDWPAMRKWSLDYFAERFGDREIEVQSGRDAGEDYETRREKFIHRTRFADFIEKVRNSGVTNDFYLTANNNSNNKQVLSELWDDIVQIPEYLDGRDRLSGFFWFGPAGTITPFHHDLTNNFMAQVMGRKRVKIAPSWDMPLMANEFHVFSRRDGRTLPEAPRPDLRSPQILECMLNPGEILFLPIGCLHFVEGVEISVTISFTNFAFDNDFSTFYNTYCGV